MHLLWLPWIAVMNSRHCLHVISRCYFWTVQFYKMLFASEVGTSLKSLVLLHPLTFAISFKLWPSCQYFSLSFVLFPSFLLPASLVIPLGRWVHVAWVFMLMKLCWNSSLSTCSLKLLWIIRLLSPFTNMVLWSLVNVDWPVSRRISVGRLLHLRLIVS